MCRKFHVDRCSTPSNCDSTMRCILRGPSWDRTGLDQCTCQCDGVVTRIKDGHWFQCRKSIPRRIRPCMSVVRLNGNHATTAERFRRVGSPTTRSPSAVRTVRPSCTERSREPCAWVLQLAQGQSASGRTTGVRVRRVIAPRVALSVGTCCAAAISPQRPCASFFPRASHAKTSPRSADNVEGMDHVDRSVEFKRDIREL